MRKVVVDVIGLLKTIDMFSGIASRAENDLDVMKDIGLHGRASVVETFLAQGRPAPWDDLAPATIRKRVARGNSSTLILRDTDETYLSFLDAGNVYTIFDYENHFVEWGNSRPDFTFHDEGTSTEPERKILQHLQEDVDIYQQMYLDFLIGER